MKTIKIWKDAKFTVEQLREERFSICCLDPCFDDEGEDRTEWPPDEILSEWCGTRIKNGNVGDNPDYLEWIAWAADEDEETR